MKIAYIIGAYADPENLKRLILALGSQSFFVHVDKETNIEPFQRALSGMKGVTLLENRTNVHWGDCPKTSESV